MLIKGILLAIGVFVVAVMFFWYWFSPKGGSFEFPVQWFGKAGLFAAGFGIAMLVIGTGLIWLGKVATTSLLSRLPK